MIVGIKKPRFEPGQIMVDKRPENFCNFSPNYSRNLSANNEESMYLGEKQSSR